MVKSTDTQAYSLDAMECSIWRIPAYGQGDKFSRTCSLIVNIHKDFTIRLETFCNPCREIDDYMLEQMECFTSFF